MEAKEVKEETKNPYTVGDILCHHSHWDAKIINAFQVVKVTKTGVKIQKIKVDSEIKVLRSQMNPHFIFNCLNTIEAYIVEKRDDEASVFLQKL